MPVTSSCRLLSCLAVGLTCLSFSATAVGQNKPLRWGIAFSCDGAFVGTCGDRVRIYDFRSGKLLREIEGRSTRCIAFSPLEPELFAVGGEDNLVRMWRVNNKNFVREFKGHVSDVRSVAMDKSGRYVASTSSRGDPDEINAGLLRVWEIESGKLVQSFKAVNGKIKGVSFSDDGKLAAFCRSRADEACHVEVYEVANWKRIASIKLSAGKELEVTRFGRSRPDGLVTRFTPNRKHLLVAGGICVRSDPKGYSYACRPTQILWHIDLARSSSSRLLVDPERSHCHSIGLSPDGKRVVSGNGPIEMRDVFSGKSLWNNGAGRGVALSPDGKFVVVGRSEGVCCMRQRARPFA